jgi:DNA-binding NarL/FixJ family response regulator
LSPASRPATVVVNPMPAARITADRESPITVLTVDDQAIFRSAAREVIDATPGFAAVGEAASGPEALTASAALRPDLVLLDVRMPGMDGIETARRLRDTHPDALVILISLEDVAAMASDADASGAATLLRKQDLCPTLLASVWARHRRA